MEKNNLVDQMESYFTLCSWNMGYFFINAHSHTTALKGGTPVVRSLDFDMCPVQTFRQFF